MTLSTIGIAGLTALTQLTALASSGGTLATSSVGFFNEPEPMVVAEVREYTVPELIDELSDHYDVDGAVALDIARCESHLRQYNKNGSVLRGEKNSSDVGVFQINEKYHLERSRKAGFDIYTTAGNVGYAMWLMARDGDRHWHWSEKCWG